MTAPIVAALCGAFLLLSQQLASAQELWRGAKYGMTPEQVHSLFPTVVTPSEPSVLGGPNDAPGTQLRGLRELEDIAIARHDFKAIFYFQDKRLQQVTLKAKDLTDTTEAMVLFDSVSNLLREKYGQELSKTFKPSSSLSRAYGHWLSGGTHISVLALSVGDGSEDATVFNINYQTRLTGEADNL
ncbi:MAG: hypothetical protein ABL989_01890 [Gammaproteobacteria bacterium]